MTQYRKCTASSRKLIFDAGTIMIYHSGVFVFVWHFKEIFFSNVTNIILKNTDCYQTLYFFLKPDAIYKAPFKVPRAQYVLKGKIFELCGVIFDTE